MISDEGMDETERATSGAEGFCIVGRGMGIGYTTEEYKEVGIYVGEETKDEKEIDGMLDEWLWNETKEIKCTCGSWATYGRSCSPLLHADYCELRK